MCARLKPIIEKTTRVIHQDKSAFVFCKIYQGRRDRRNFERTRKQQFNVASKQSGDSISVLHVTWPQDIIYCDMINE